MEVLSACKLGTKKCQPCEGGVEPATADEARRQIAELDSGWQLSEDGKMISRTWRFKNFVQAMKLLNLAADLAEQDQHHPDLHLTGYRNLKIDLTTHAIDGLSENDFILAAKIDAAAEGLN